MATSGKKQTFKDFYGDLDTDIDNIDLGDSLSSDKDTDSRNVKDTSDKESKESKTGKSNSAEGDGNSSKNKTSDKGKNPGKSKTSENRQDSGKFKTSGDRQNRSGKSKTPGASKEAPGASSRCEVHTEWAGGPEPRVYRGSPEAAAKNSVLECTDGLKVKRIEEDTMTGSSKICHFCEKTGTDQLKRCSRCLAVSYCKAECQQRDFKEHKMFCKRCDRFDVARARAFPAVRFFKNMRHARDYAVLLRDMPLEWQYQCGAWCNLLVEVVGKLFHFCRHSILVRDLAGETTKIIFHDPSNLYTHPVYKGNRVVSLPISLGDCLKPGSFLLLMGVHWRFFMDGTTGIRINDLNSMYLIQMEDYPIPRDYRKDMEQKTEVTSTTLEAKYNKGIKLLLNS